MKAVLGFQTRRTPIRFARARGAAREFPGVGLQSSRASRACRAAHPTGGRKGNELPVGWFRGGPPQRASRLPGPSTVAGDPYRATVRRAGTRPRHSAWPWRARTFLARQVRLPGFRSRSARPGRGQESHRQPPPRPSPGRPAAPAPERSGVPARHRAVPATTAGRRLGVRRGVAGLPALRRSPATAARQRAASPCSRLAAARSSWSAAATGPKSRGTRATLPLLGRDRESSIARSGIRLQPRFSRLRSRANGAPRPPTNSAGLVPGGRQPRFVLAKQSVSRVRGAPRRVGSRQG